MGRTVSNEYEDSASVSVSANENLLRVGELDDDLTFNFGENAKRTHADPEVVLKCWNLAAQWELFL
jgi:hypothetical protein